MVSFGLLNGKLQDGIGILVKKHAEHPGGNRKRNASLLQEIFQSLHPFLSLSLFLKACWHIGRRNTCFSSLARFFEREF